MSVCKSVHETNNARKLFYAKMNTIPRSCSPNTLLMVGYYAFILTHL